MVYPPVKSCSSRRRSKMRFAVCRCLRWSSLRSPRSHSSMNPVKPWDHPAATVAYFCTGVCIDEKGEVTESDVTAFLREFDIDPKVTWPRDVLENLERWLTCFFPARYETARESIKLTRAHAISPRRQDGS